MRQPFDRRKFLLTAAAAGLGFGAAFPRGVSGRSKTAAGKRVGIIGLDTSHSIAFTKELNADGAGDWGGYRVEVAYPRGSLDIASSVDRIPAYTEQVRKMGVEIVDGIPSLLKRCDVVLLETNDGRRHLEQALPVLQAGKRMFIDKPVTASLAEAIALYQAAEHYRVPVFSCSSLRFMDSAQQVASGSVGKVLGADAYSPCTLESTHPDFFWYGIHGVELLYTVMGTGCREVTRIHTEDTDVAVGIWEDGRIGSFRGTRTGKHTYGGTVYGEKGDAVLGPFGGYNPLLKEIIKYFDTGVVPVRPEDTMEICAFMEAADESRRRKGAGAKLAGLRDRAADKARRRLRDIL